ncbi:MAG: hypothetical protein JXR95_08305 [Deltaproteobacteria bacterium]|nr:hypothetical protein [Deltaproteobacteria bacterium]
MGIVRMKKIYLTGPLRVRDEAVLVCQNAGVLHIKDLGNHTEPAQEVAFELARSRRILDHITKLSKKSGIEPSDVNIDEQQLIDNYENIMSEKSALEQEISTLEKELRVLKPWGDFSPDDLSILKNHNISFYFVSTTSKELKAVDSDVFSKAFYLKKIELKGPRNIGFILGYSGEAPESDMEHQQLPDISLHTVEQQLKEKTAVLEDLDNKLTGLCAHKKIFENFFNRNQSAYDRAKVRSGTLEDGPLFSIGGFAPSVHVDTLIRHFKKLPVVVTAEDPSDEDDVPIKLKNGPVIRYFEPLIKMFNLPTYREPDPTILVAPFMAVFFAFCFGDAAYGLGLLGLGSLLAWKFGKKSPDAVPFFRLLQILGVSTFVIGAVMGQFFGVNLITVSWAKPVKDVFFIANLATDPMQLFYFSIKLGLIQLGVAFIIKMMISLQRKEYQILLSTIGLFLLLPLGWFLLFEDGMKNSVPVLSIAGISVFLILFFSFPDKNFFKRFGAGLWALYGVSGLLGDIISYARIFGLGLSSGIIAMVVNNMAVDIFHSAPVIGAVFAFILLVVGHLFNFAMAIMGSLVHSARLNFLEYYGKFFDGGGKPYTPLINREKTNQ